jgi:glutamate-1-semialdehyde 2,1-aminomutase
MIEIFRKMNVLYRVYERLCLSLAKHPSLLGHPKIALRLSRWVRAYVFGPGEVWRLDDAPEEVVALRKSAIKRLSDESLEKSPQSQRRTRELSASVSDLEFVNRYRVPFPFQNDELSLLGVGNIVDRTEGVKVRDLDGNWSFDLGGSYGVNLFGHDFYKHCIDRGVEEARSVGLLLGPYHPKMEEVVAGLKRISRLDEVSFHMSGTEAVMQAVRLARFHTRRKNIVRFCGAYHGWWDGVQVGPGNPLSARDVFTLKEMSDDTLKVLRMRDDIACVLVNPLQALTPNRGPANDSTLMLGREATYFNKESYRKWLESLRRVCSEKGIALIFDEVFLGFRLAKGGVQEYFGVSADLVTYGKTLGGGLPVGVLCGKHRWMKRFVDNRPADMCFARGTFNSHPYVVATMSEFLRFLETPAAQSTWDNIDERWNHRARRLNSRLSEAGVPMRVSNMTSVFVTHFTEEGRYHWLWQYYLRHEGLFLSWTGSARFIFSHDYSEADFDEVCLRIVRSARRMAEDGWLYPMSRESRARSRRSLALDMLTAMVGWRHQGRKSAPENASDNQPLTA